MGKEHEAAPGNEIETEPDEEVGNLGRHQGQVESKNSTQNSEDVSDPHWQFRRCQEVSGDENSGDAEYSFVSHLLLHPYLRTGTLSTRKLKIGLKGRDR